MLLYTPTGLQHPHAQIVIDGHLRLEQGDTGAIAAMFSPLIVWHEAGAVPPVTAYIGIPAVMGFWKHYFGAAGRNFHQDIQSVMANDEYVISIVHLRGSKTAIEYDSTAVDVMRINDGLITEFWRYYNDISAAQHFFAAHP